MHLLTMLLAPGSKLVRDYDCIPRSLADDTLVYAEGADAFPRAAEALLMTHPYIPHVGGEVRVSKIEKKGKQNRRVIVEFA